MRPGDSLTSISDRAGIMLDRFLLENIAQLDNLGSSVVGKELLLCKPKTGRHMTLARG